MLADSKGRAVRYHLVQKHAQRPHVALVVVGLASAELRREVAWRAANRLGHGERAMQNGADPKVSELDNMVAG